MKSRHWYQQRDEALKTLGEPPTDEIEALAHTLKVYTDSPDDEFVKVATRGIYDEGVTTGLTYGHLRAIARRLGIDV